MSPQSVAGLVLASGMSRRFGDGNKLTASLDGMPVVWWTVRAYVSAGLSTVVVVVGHEAMEVGEALQGLPVSIVHNPDFEGGQSQALLHGVRSLSPHTTAAVIGVGDQPHLTSTVIHNLIDVHTGTGATVVAPRYSGHPGNPVLFSAQLFPELLEVKGDQGGRSVIQRHASEIHWVDVTDDRAGIDVDTLEDLERLRRDR